jgi:Uma2 family endonuclease
MEHAIVSAMESARRRATWDDLLAVPDHMVAELIDGELYTSPRPAPPHALASSGIGSVLFDRFNGPPGGGSASPGGWWILFEPELHFGDDVLVPDLAGWRRERLPALPDLAYFTLAPDWVCEVISPSSGRLDRVKKMPVYAREGVAHLWLIDRRRWWVD